MSKIRMTLIKFQLPFHDDLEIGAKPVRQWPRTTVPLAVTLTSHDMKEGPAKEITIKALSDSEGVDLCICPVRTLLAYLHHTAIYCHGLAHDSTLFLGQKKPHSPVQASTLGSWMKKFLQSCEIDSNAHGARGQAASSQLHLGAPLQEVLKATNWASEETFRKYYYVPPPTLPVSNMAVTTLLEHHSRTKQQ